MNPELEQFAIQHHSYSGQSSDPNDILINNNLQKFIQEAGLIAGLACNGKISLDKAHLDIIEKLTEINAIRVHLRQEY
jgi:hypothetical protein